MHVKTTSFTVYFCLSTPQTNVLAIYNTSYTTPLKTPHSIQVRNMNICIYLNSFLSPAPFCAYLTEVKFPLAEKLPFVLEKDVIFISLPATIMRPPAYPSTSCVGENDSTASICVAVNLLRFSTVIKCCSVCSITLPLKLFLYNIFIFDN